MRKRILGMSFGFCALVVFFTAFLVAPLFGQQSARVNVLIGFNRQPGPTEEALVRRSGGSIKHTYRLVRGIAASLPEGAVEALRRNPNILTIEPDGFFHKIDAELDNAWGVKHIGAGAVHDGGNKGANVKVAIIDSGIDYTHQDLGSCFGQNCKVAGGFDFVNNDGNPMDDDGHGTHVAGTVAAGDNDMGVVGVAPEAKLYALKVLNASGSGSFSDIIKALEWVVDNGIKITNNSYGSSSDPGSLVRAAFDNSYAAGVLHIAAAGNSGNCAGKNNSIGYPARYESVVAVAATTSSDSRACWSSTGPAMELAAPGVGINSTKMGGGYVVFSGTSMASPHAAGLAALIAGTGQPLTNSDIRNILASTARDIGPAGQDPHYGFGLIDAVAAVAGVSSPVTPTPAVNVNLSTGKLSYLAGSDTEAVLTAVVSDEYGNPIAGLGSSAFVTRVDGSAVSLGFSETASGTYVGSLGLSGLSNGAHGVSVTVTDTRTLSGSGAANFSIQSASNAAMASVSSITYASTGGRSNDKHLNVTATVNDDLGSPVSGATVSIKLWRDGSMAESGSGTTNGSGMATFTYNNAPSGTYTTEITDLVAAGLSWDGITPINEFNK